MGYIFGEIGILPDCVLGLKYAFGANKNVNFVYDQIPSALSILKHTLRQCRYFPRKFPCDLVITLMWELEVFVAHPHTPSSGAQMFLCLSTLVSYGWCWVLTPLKRAFAPPGF